MLWSNVLSYVVVFCALALHPASLVRVRCWITSSIMVAFILFEICCFSSAPCEIMNNSVTFCNGKQNVPYWLIVLSGEHCFSSLAHWLLLSESYISWTGQIVLPKWLLVKPINKSLHTFIIYSFFIRLTLDDRLKDRVKDLRWLCLWKNKKSWFVMYTLQYKASWWSRCDSCAES